MGMPLDDLASGAQRHVVKRVGKLAEPAARRRHQAARLQHPPRDEAAPGARASHLPPEAEHRARRQHRAVEAPRRRAQILHLAPLQGALARPRIAPQR